MLQEFHFLRRMHVRLSDAVEGFMRGYFSTRRRSGKTQAAYQVDLHQLQAYLGDGMGLPSVEAEGLESWATEMRAKGYASVSIRRKLATTRVFFGYWLRKGALDRSPFWKIRLDLGTERVLPRSLTPSAVKHLIEESWRRAARRCPAVISARDPRFLRIRDVAAVELLFATAVRVGELVSLGLGDWREEERCFVVHGKGSRQRLAPLPDARSFWAVQRYVAHRRAMPLPHDALLVNASGRRISTQGIARILASTAERAGVNQRVTPHMMRHTVATLLLRHGADIRIVQEVLGHSSIATTQRYTHVSKEHLVSVLEARHPSHHLNIKIPASARRHARLPRPA